MNKYLKVAYKPFRCHTKLYFQALSYMRNVMGQVLKVD